MTNAIKSPGLWSGSVSFDAGGAGPAGASPFQPGLDGDTGRGAQGCRDSCRAHGESDGGKGCGPVAGVVER